MASLRIAGTDNRTLQALAAAGQTGIEAWGTLHALLERELSPAHAALLAEPVANEVQGTVDWYALGEGDAARLIDLPPPARDRLQAVLDGLVADIRALTARLGASRADGDRFLSDTLGLAMQLPGPEFVYVRGGQPVLVAWAHTRQGQAGGNAVLTGSAVRPSGAHTTILPAPPSPYAATAGRRQWLWGVLALSLLAPLLTAFIMIRDPFGWFAVNIAQCQLVPGQLGLVQGLEEGVARESVLRAELARLTADAGQRRLMCPPERAAAAPPPPLPVRPPASADAQRAEREGAHEGRLQVILAWDDTNDLDLRIYCPNGDDINFSRRTACGGQLDVDANGDVRNLTQSPVESVFFDNPAPGRYRVVVDPYGMRERSSTPFRVTVRREGQRDQVVTGLAQNGQRSRTVVEFSVEASP